MEGTTITAGIGFTEERNVQVYIYGDWYVQHGGTYVNECLDRSDLFDGCLLDEIQDFDRFSWPEPINSLEELITAVNS